MLHPTSAATAPRRHRATFVAVVLAAVVALTAAGFSPLGAGVAHGAARLKAVVIVGPSGGLQSSNLSDGEHIAQVAASYGMDVRRVFHPHATWSAVLDNIQGATIVVYLGHGNGWPSQYAPFQTNTKDGFGLDPFDGASSTSVQYYGEGPIAANIDLAPNAVVLLNHLCYASGNRSSSTESGTEAAARERVDNYGAGFLRAGARAVFAYGHQDVSAVIDGLFTTHDTMDQIFMGRGYYGTHDIRFPSVRTPGYDAHLDPESTTSFYRSVIGRLSMTAVDVTGAPFARTDLPPATLIAPGNATVTDAGPADVLYPLGGAVLGALDSGTLVRLAEGPLSGPDGRDYFLASSPMGGYVRADQLTPADSTGPRAWEVAPTVLAFSPNGDGAQDTLPVTVTWSEAATWTAKVEKTDGTDLKTWTGSGTDAAFTWTGLTGSGARYADGQYRLVLAAVDGLGNVGDPSVETVRIDTVAPTLAQAGTSDIAAASATPVIFTPNGDGTSDTLVIGYDMSEAGYLVMSVRNGAGTLVRRDTLAVRAGTGSVTWDGRSASGAYVADGRYDVQVLPRDQAGNAGDPITKASLVLTSLKNVRLAPAIFYSRDMDKLAPYTQSTFTLTKDATVTWSVATYAGAAVKTLWSNHATAAASYVWSWNGRNAAGTYVADGKYIVSVTATTAAGTVTYRRVVFVGAFQIVPSTTTLTRGKSVTVAITSAEALSRYPSLTVIQPGLTAYTVTTTKTGTYTYKATFTPKSGTAGTAVLKVYSKDINGVGQQSHISVPLN